MDRIINVMKRNSHFDFLSVQYLLYPDLIRPFEGQFHLDQDIQIIGGGMSQHWRCLFYDGSLLHILDSLGPKEFKTLPKDEKAYIKKRYPKVQMKDIVSGYVTQQPDHNSCGINAAAIAITLILQKNPYEIRHSRNVEAMRNHFLQIVTTEQLNPFPEDKRM